MIKAITESKTFKTIKWSILLFAVLSMIFTTLTILGENNFAEMTLAGEPISTSTTYSIDVSGVENREALIERLEVTADKARIAEEKAELKEKEKEVNARAASLE